MWLCVYVFTTKIAFLSLTENPIGVSSNILGFEVESKLQHEVINRLPLLSNKNLSSGERVYCYYGCDYARVAGVWVWL